MSDKDQAGSAEPLASRLRAPGITVGELKAELERYRDTLTVELCIEGCQWHEYEGGTAHGELHGFNVLASSGRLLLIGREGW